MGRPREFDEDHVLDRALETFWAHGYEGTSIDELVRSTGLGRASLYNAFGDKDRLFLRVIERYLARSEEQFRPPEGSSVREQLAHALLSTVHNTCARSGPRGCLLLLAGSEQQCPAPVRERLEASLSQRERAFEALIAAGQADGSLARRGSPRALARMLLVLQQGLAATARAGWGRDRLESAAREGLAHVLGDEPEVAPARSS